MKMFMKILVSLCVISVLFAMIPFESTCSELHNDVLRLHILANSDTQLDQNLKLSVRDAVLSEISPLYNDVQSKDEAISITQDNLDLIEKVAQDVVSSYNKTYTVKADVTNKFFDTRYYDDFTMPAGMYDTLQISIGKAEGKNWWCVMYPSLCVGASSKISMKNDLSENEYEVITSDDVEFKFKIVEYYEKFSALFN